MLPQIDRQRGIGVLDYGGLEFIDNAERSSRAQENQKRRRVFHFVSVARITFELITVFFVADEAGRTWIRASKCHIGRPGDYDVIDWLQKERIKNCRT